LTNASAAAINYYCASRLSDMNIAAIVPLTADILVSSVYRLSITNRITFDISHMLVNTIVI
jgi:hypothetical protein